MVAHVGENNKNFLGSRLRIENLSREQETAEHIGVRESRCEMRSFGSPRSLESGERCQRMQRA